ncbi:outer membrane beta-barrel protein [Elizabethkingia meningoseptica]|uniref:outer membrane beta-barrel protein n=1 Tax=Elizabethkingia meningoseptica TaxID=238 RepID=UPI002DD6A33B|nr:outer membrane beta-barrel protein [Elizabethkingia meningoseptica]MEC4712215.1 outer membrane beta-barrel protein [Elizabethkingia meningoseptica]
MRKYFLLFILFIGVLNYGQSLNITGKIVDQGNKPIEDATVYLLKQKDSSIINYTNSGKEGNFNLKFDKIQEPVFFRVNADNHKEYGRTFDKLESSQKLETIKLITELTKNIAGVEIKGAPPVKVKKDTLEFNAASFKVKLDGKAEELIKALPGFEISNDGKITANGKEVDQILVNGKPFFDKNGKIALKNLPADLIKKIQVTTSKTDEERVKGEKGQSNNVSVNLTIDEKKNKGFMARAYAGYGSDKRYEGSAILSYFKKNTKISLLASSNNINVSGFKSDEVYESMGYGRNSNLIQGNSYVQDGDRIMVYSGGDSGSGVLRSTMVGVNYSDELAKDASLDGLSLLYMNNNRETKSLSDRTTLLSDYTLRTRSQNSGENDTRQYSLDNSFRIKLDKNTNFYMSNTFLSNNGTSINNGASSTFRDGILLNENNSYNKNDSRNNSGQSRMYFSRKLNEKGRRVSFSMFGSAGEVVNDNLIKSETIFNQEPGKNDIRNQKFYNKTLNNQYNISAEYSEPISDSANVAVVMAYKTTYNRTGRDVNDFNAATGDYSSFNELLSNNMIQKNNSFVPSLRYNLNKKKLNLWATMNLNLSQMDVNARYNGQNYELNKNFVLPEFNVNLWSNSNNGKNMSVYMSSNYGIPSALQLTPYEDKSNPLISYKGNPDLKNTWRFYTGAYYSKFNQAKNTNLYFNLNFNYQDNDVTSNRHYNKDTGGQEITYINVSGNKSINLSTGYTKSYKWKDNKLSVGPKISFNHGFNHGFVDGSRYTSSSYSVSPGLNLTYEIKDRMTIKPSYTLSYNQSDYKNYVIDNSHTTSNVFSLQSINYFGKTQNFTVENNFTYTTNSNIAPGFKKDFYFWNASVGYTFFKKQMTAKVMVYDVLNQNQSVKRVITDTYIEDREDLILKRYVMFTLSYKFNKFGNKKKS